ncbi:GerAB/ArcD/ProY family transporter [Paenibacillus sp. XY044]|uniref:GerAB/ArcD/ProY family transporter n=1 Tax=Paenibacillus sp. XY044 TaxID=2026089 RepID=UPI000B985E16|nr:GerAB/ArcD/ProY family transporter [Paenibacillus sp. XY044]OZB91280.1 spore gernimation protein [Paenibacillus sp. XY044]
MKEKLSAFHVTILIYMTQVGVYSFSLPRLLAQHFGTNGWLAILILAPVVFLNTAIIAVVYRLAKGKSVLEMMERSISKVLLFPIYLFLCCFWVTIGCLAAKEYILIFQIIAFSSTNPMVFMFTFCALAYLLINKEIYNIAKVSTIFYIITVWILFLFLFFYHDVRLTRLTPFIFQGGNPDKIKGFFDAYPAFLGYELTILLFPYSDKKTHLMRSAFVSSGMVTISYVFISFISFGFFSLGQLKVLQYPILNLFAYVHLPLIERIENLLYGFLLFTTMITTAMNSWAAVEVGKRMFPKLKNAVLSFVIILFGYMISFIPKVLMEAQRWLQYAGYIEIGFAFGFPIALILLLLIQRSRGELQP